MTRSFACVWVLAFLSAAAALPGCSVEEEGLVVSLQSDFVAGVEIDTARITLDEAAERTVSLEAGTSLSRPYRLTTYAMVLDGRRDVEVSLLSSGAVVAVRRVSVPFVRSRLVNVVISRTCRGVVCDETETCIAGTCESPRCETGTEPECPRPQCRGATECTSATDCVEPTCVAGICLEAGSEAGCSATQACVPGVGCITLAERDAGRFDGGAPLDAGPGMGLVCDPCAASSECLGATACALIAGGARACVPRCTLEMPTCPSGFTCGDDGSGIFACLPTGGICCVDEDGDGHGAGRGCLGTDCDDDDPSRNPARLETCNGVDDDCDGSVDDPPVDCGASTCDADGVAYVEGAGEQCRAGSCMPGGAPSSCGLFTCSGGGDAGDVCARSCASAAGGDDDRFCVTGAHCDAGACVSDASVGGGCDEDTDCATGRCRDGTCCMPGVDGCTCAGGPTETVCDDAADSDCDGGIDCADSDCDGRSCGSLGRTCSGGVCACPGGSSESACADGADDDCDGLLDCGDADCGGRACGSGGRVCVGASCACPGGATETACDDGADDDCDGQIDCADSSCGGRTCAPGRFCAGSSCVCAGGGTELVCSDGADGDCDGAIDCADPDCAGAACADGGRTCSGGSCNCGAGGAEARCDDGVDGDCDSQIDCADGDCEGDTCGPFGRRCAAGTCACPLGGSERCDNGSDDDCDGQVDCADAGCAGMACGTGGRTCSAGACGCAGGSTESRCDDGMDDDCDGETDCADTDCRGLACGGGRTCCPGCVTLPPMYTHYTTQALMCPGVSLGGSTYGGLCAVHAFYTSTCGPQDMSGWFPGWEHAPSNPPGCDYNGCDASGNCEENFCIPCPAGDCSACPGAPRVTPC